MKLPLTYFIFNSILEIVYFLGYPIVRYVVKRRYDLQAMRIPEKRSDNPILIHAASVGEINAVMPLLRYLEEKQIPFVINTMSITGRDHAQKAFPDISVRLSALDIGSLRKRQLESLNPRLILIVETEIWPNLLAQASYRISYSIHKCEDRAENTQAIHAHQISFKQDKRISAVHYCAE